MLRRLRWQLSMLYILAAGLLILLIGGGVYGLINYYFKSSTDLALQYKVASEYSRLGLPVPPNLQAANQTWQTQRKVTTPVRKLTSPAPTPKKGGNEEDSEDTAAAQSGSSDEESYDSELASIFLLPIDPQGKVIANPNSFGASAQPDQTAINAAMANGSDLRTVTSNEGNRTRLFSYRVSAENGLAVLQVGRSLKEQDLLLEQLLVGMVVLSGLSVLGVGLGSWWLAGRSLIPAQQAWDRQQIFIANASHELRIPLTLLRASAEVARRGLDSTDERAELLGDILGETDHMSALVEDLLLLSRLDAGRLQLDQKPVDSAALVTELGREMGRVAASSGVRVEVLHSQGVALADPIRLRQVLLILFDNALRHTPKEGTVRISARLDGKRVVFEVSDSGSGIPAEDLPHVFERFYRGNEDRRRPGEGNGLGLAIAKGLVEAMHGHITLASLPGEGTRVTFYLPAVLL